MAPYHERTPDDSGDSGDALTGIERRNPGYGDRATMLALAGLFVETQKMRGNLTILTDDGVMSIDDLALREAVKAFLDGDEASVDYLLGMPADAIPEEINPIPE